MRLSDGCQPQGRFPEGSQTLINTGQNYTSNGFRTERNENRQQRRRNQANFNEFLEPHSICGRLASSATSRKLRKTPGASCLFCNFVRGLLLGDLHSLPRRACRPGSLRKKDHFTRSAAPQRQFSSPRAACLYRPIRPGCCHLCGAFLLSLQRIRAGRRGLDRYRSKLQNDRT